MNTERSSSNQAKMAQDDNNDTVGIDEGTDKDIEKSDSDKRFT